MLKSRFFSFFLPAFLVVAAAAQSPTSGRIVGNSYVNSYFHLTYTWPTVLQPQPIPAPDPKNAGSYEFLLFSARQGSLPYGIAIVAEKLNVAGPHSTGVNSAAELLDRMQHSLRPGPILSNISRCQKKSANGVVFEELDFLQNGKPSSVLATQAGAYVLLFKCNAQKAEDIAAMQKSALGIRFGH